MATRIYVTDTAAPVTPGATRGTWSASGSALDKAIKTTKEGSYASLSLSPALTSGTLYYRFVSPPLATTTTISGTVSAVLMATVSSSAGNGRYHAYVMAPDGSVRGTLLSTANTGTLAPNSLQGYALIASATAISSVSPSVGDRIVFEAGFVQTFGSPTGVMGRGGTSGTDLTATNTDTTRPGWFELSANLTFNPEPSGGRAFILF